MESAAAAYQTAVRLNPNYSLAHKLLGGAHLGLQNWKAAEEALLQAVKIKGSFADAWADLGMARRWLKDLDGATMALQLATFHQPDHVRNTYSFQPGEGTGGHGKRSPKTPLFVFLCPYLLG
jgi:tetratricopeptide (TPR) repeat protein